MPKYTPPEQVTSPKRRWSLIKVLYDPKAANECVMALGIWDNKPALALRWNGSDDNPVGTPQSRGLATWFIVHERYHAGLLSTLSAEMQNLARNVLKTAA